MGAKLILVGRNRELGQSWCARFSAPEIADAELMLADLSNRRQRFAKLAADFLATNRPLHVLMNNAGRVQHETPRPPKTASSRFSQSIISPTSC